MMTGVDLVLELAGLLGGLRLVLRGDREAVLLLARDLPLARHVLGGVAHVVAVEGVPQAVLDHRVDELDVAHLGAVAQVRAMRRLAHALLAAGDHDPGRSELDLLGAERHRAKPRAAQLVHAPGRRVDRDAGVDRGLARRVLARAGGEDLPQDDLGYLSGLNPRAIERRLDRDLAQLVGRQAGERAVERADGRAGSARDHDGSLILAHRCLQKGSAEFRGRAGDATNRLRGPQTLPSQAYMPAVSQSQCRLRHGREQAAT